jgi:signal peptidase I
VFDPALLLAQQAEPSQAVQMMDRVARAPLSTIVIFAAVCTAVRLALWPVMKSTPPHQRTGLFKTARFVNEMADALVYAAVVVFMLVRPFGIQTFFIPSGSMIDTLLVNDMIVANKWVYRTSEPKAGDIVVFRPPQYALNPGQSDTDFIKRLIGVPGDVIEWRDKTLYRNGAKVDEPYVDYTDGPSGNVLPAADWPSVPQADFKLVKDGDRLIPLHYVGEFANQPGTIFGTVEPFAAKNDEEARRWVALPAEPIPAGHYLFMGDNRNGSSDGRFWGLIKREAIIGRSEAVWFPFNRMGRTR